MNKIKFPALEAGRQVSGFRFFTLKGLNLNNRPKGIARESTTLLNIKWTQGSTLSGLVSLLLIFRGFHPRLFKLSPFRTFRMTQFSSIALFILLLSGTVHAQDSLSVYLELAGKNNPGVKAAFSQYLAALEKVPQVGSLPDPQGSFDFFLKPMELLNGNQVGSISVMQMFPWFGTLKLAKDEASLMAKAQFSLFQESKAALFYNVKTSWYQLAKYKRGILLINQNIALLESIEKLALVKFQSPTGSS